MILNETFCALFRGYLAPVVRHFITLNLFSALHCSILSRNYSIALKRLLFFSPHDSMHVSVQYPPLLFIMD